MPEQNGQDEADAKAWVALALAKKGATADQAPAATPSQDGLNQSHHNGVNGGDRDGVIAGRAVPNYPHESEYGGGKAYVSAPYTGGKSILEPEVSPPSLATECWHHDGISLTCTS